LISWSTYNASEPARRSIWPGRSLFTDAVAQEEDKQASRRSKADCGQDEGRFAEAAAGDEGEQRQQQCVDEGRKGRPCLGLMFDVLAFARQLLGETEMATNSKPMSAPETPALATKNSLKLSGITG
jgi:hypothetical protein